MCFHVARSVAVSPSSHTFYEHAYASCIPHSLAASRAQVHPPSWRAINVRPPASLLTDNHSPLCVALFSSKVECNRTQKSLLSFAPLKSLFYGFTLSLDLHLSVFAVWKTWLESLTASVQICIQTRLPPAVTTVCTSPRNRRLFRSPPLPTAATTIITSRPDSALALRTARSALTSTRITAWTASSTTLNHTSWASETLSAPTARTAPAPHQLLQMLVNIFSCCCHRY